MKTVFEWLAFLTGLAGVYLTIKQKISSWPIELVAIIITAYLLYIEKLYGNACLQIFYFVLSIYGWVVWKYDSNLKHITVARLSSKQIVALLIATALQALLYYYLLLYFKGNAPLLDACLTAASVTATFLMTKKYIENWLAWIVIDILYVVLYVQQELILLAVLSVLFSILAITGFYSWRKIRLNALQ